MSKVTEVCSAIAALSDPKSTNRANEWLVSFERSVDCWEVAEILLSESISGPSSRFFGAKFLYSKIQKQFVQLSRDQADGLADRLVQHLIQLSLQENVDIQACRYLSLSIAAIALQLNSDGIVDLILQRLNPIITTRPLILLMLLTVLPEEAENRQILVSASFRKQFLSQLIVSSMQIVNFLSHLLTQLESLEDRTSILKCACNWFSILDVKSVLSQNRTILDFSLQVIVMSRGDLFDCAVDFVVIVTRRLYPKDGDILRLVFETVLNQRDQVGNALRKYGSDVHNDDYRSEALAFARLFTETAEACLTFFLTQVEFFGREMLFEQLLLLASFPYDHLIARIPLKLFYDLSRSIKVTTDEDDAGYEEGEVNEIALTSHDKASLRQKMSMLFLKLLEISVNSMSMEDLNGLLSNELSSEKNDARLEWKETILDCCDVLTYDACMEWLCQSMETEIRVGGDQINWTKIESILLAMHFIAPNFQLQGKTYVPQLVGFLLRVPANLIRVHITTIQLLGSLSTWVAGNSGYINLILEKLMNDLRLPLLSLEASRSILAIFRTCSTNNAAVLPINQCHQQVTYLMGIKIENLDNEVIFNLLEAMVISASSMPVQDSETIFKAIVSLQYNEIQRNLQPGIPLNSIDSQDIVVFLDRISIIFKHFRLQEQFVALTFLEIFPALKRVIEVFPKEKLCEKLCRVYKYVIRTCGLHFAVALPMFCEHLASQFSITTYSAFLYASSICVSTFARIDSSKHVPLLYNLLWSLSQTFFLKYPRAEEFNIKPDLVEEYFYLVSKYLQYCPALFLDSSEKYNSIINIALNGLLSVNHREAQKGMLLFFDRIIDLPSYWQTNDLKYSLASELARKVGESITVVIIKMLSGVMPVYALDERDGCVSDVLWSLKKRFTKEFQEWIMSALSSTSRTVQMIADRQNLMPLLLSTTSHREFSFALDQFEVSCRRNL